MMEIRNDGKRNGRENKFTLKISLKSGLHLLICNFSIVNISNMALPDIIGMSRQPCT